MSDSENGEVEEVLDGEVEVLDIEEEVLDEKIDEEMMDMKYLLD